jgi:hypothetical protein
MLELATAHEEVAPAQPQVLPPSSVKEDWTP